MKKTTFSKFMHVSKALKLGDLEALEQALKLFTPAEFNIALIRNAYTRYYRFLSIPGKTHLEASEHDFSDKECLKAIELLNTYGPAPHADDLFAVARFGSLEPFKHIIELYLNAKNDINTADTFGRNILYYIAAKDQPFATEQAQFLFLKGIDLNHQDKHGYNPLIVAAHTRCIDMVTTLIHLGANERLHTRMGHTLFDTLEDVGFPQDSHDYQRVISALEQRELAVSTPHTSTPLIASTGMRI